MKWGEKVKQFSIERLTRTATSERYAVYTTDEDLYAKVDIHYADKVDVGILLLMQEPDEEVNDEEIRILMYRLEMEVILSYVGKIRQVLHTVSIGKVKGEYDNKINR